jgi:hypothetical protein
MAERSGRIDDNPATRRFLNDHDDLWEHVASILATQDLAEARDAVAAIQQLLAAHLQLEEGPAGVFDAMETANPRLGDVLERLRGDHDRLRAQLAGLAAAAGQPDELARIKAFAAALRVHEGRERAALEAARRG